MNYITSGNNPLVKEVKLLKSRKHREGRGLFFIEGTRFVEEAVKERAQIQKLLISEELYESGAVQGFLSDGDSIGYEVYILPQKLFKEISDTENPQGILAVIKPDYFQTDRLMSGECSFLVLLDSIQDPGNMGTIIRTADAAGVQGIIASKGCVDIYNPKVLRATMGSVFHIPVCVSDDLAQTALTLKARGFKIYASHPGGSVDYFDIPSWTNSAVVIGNEANGISDEVAHCADLLVKIPMAGRAESLNASVAGALLMYEALRSKIK
ncbi:TrmH family RNA methyltransferase [Anaerobacterium chartisolvens]|uniref:TrmH family RNA methyltransferase n=1 Tax=Anaerobacterium chartisolvens TaxID=1297424 RepID=A0A369AWN0_9FIRM|nr:RNA methyltransferase [Anaerobacterium chartisolvens]RCX13782.1 TrmH family RNA methyltransferase [Anaerobacterium chartisolvens]